MRPRYWHGFQGQAYFDDVYVAPLSEFDQLLSNGGFEEMKPAYWAPTGAGATWSTSSSTGSSV